MRNTFLSPSVTDILILPVVKNERNLTSCGLEVPSISTSSKEIDLEVVPYVPSARRMCLARGSLMLVYFTVFVFPVGRSNLILLMFAELLKIYG